MSFFDDVKQAWASADQNRLAGLMRLDYSDENTWKAKAVEFLAASEEAQIQTVELFRLAKHVQEQLFGSTKLTWLLHIVPHLLNSYNGQDFDAPEWAAAAAADKLLPEPEWQDVQGWVHDWTKRLIKQAGNFRDNLGLFQQTAGASQHRPAVFHPFVLRVLHQHGIPAGTSFTAQELAEWLLENTLIGPTAGASVSTGFAAGPTIFKLSAMSLSEKLQTTFEANCLCDKQAPAAWQGKEKKVQQLLDACPFWHEAKLATSLRGLSLDRLKKVAGTAGLEIEIAAGTLPSFHNVMSDAARFPLPEYRSAHSATPFWDDEQFKNLIKSLNQLESKASEQEKKLKAAAEVSKATALGCHSFSSIAGTPLCSIALPQLVSELNLREYSVRLLLTQQLRSARTGTADNFPFEQSKFLADTPVWQKAVHGASPSGDNAATLASWLALEPWDGLRGKFMSADLADAEALWKQVHENEQFKLLIANPPPSTLPAAADLFPLRRKLAMLTLTGHHKWEELLNTLVAALRRLEGNSASDAYRLFAAARLDLSVTAAAAGKSPAAAVGGSNLADFNEFKKLLEVANAASQSALAWETRSGFNAVILLARYVELIGDLFFAKELQNSIGISRIKGLIEESIRELRQGKVLPGSDLPFALAASDLLRFARERGAGLTGELAAVPTWLQPSDLTGLTAKFTDRAVLQQMASAGGLGFRLFLLAVMQVQLDLFERGRRLLVRPPKEVEAEGFVGLNTLHGLHEAVRMAFCAEPLLRLGLHDEQDADAPWWQPEYWFAKDSRPTEGNPIQTVNWLESWEDNDADLSQAQVNALGWAAWLGSRVPKRLPVGFDGAAAYHAAVYSSDLLCDIDGRYSGELSYLTYKAVVGTLGVEIGNMRGANEEFIAALQQQRADINTDEIKKLLKEPLYLNTSDFREQIQAALAEVRRAEAELEAAEHESLAAEFEVIANQMLLDAAKLEMDREQKNIEVTELDAQITNIGVDIVKLDEQIAAGGVEEKKNTVEKAKLVIKQTELRKEQAQAQLDAIKLEIEFIRKIVGAEDPNNPGEYGIPVEINGETKIANGQMAAMAMRTKDILSKQIDRQIQEATKAYEEAKKAEDKARKKAKRNGLIKAACRFIGSVVGAIYGGPAGAALGAEIGEALAEMTIGIMDNKPPMDILTGLVDNAFSIASAAGFDLEKELNEMGSKAAGEISSCLKGFEEKFKPMLAEMPKVLDQGLLQDALEVLGLEELKNVSGLSANLYAGVQNDIGNLGQIGTVLKGASGLERADDLTKHFKNNLVSQTTSLAFDDLKALAGRVGEQVEALTDDNPAARKEVLEKVANKVAPLITGAIATKAGQFRQRVMKDWIEKKRGSEQFWNIPAVKEEGEKLLAHLFPENEKARGDAAVNMALVLLPPELYKGEIQKYLYPYQQKQDALIKGILDMPEPSGNGSAFWQAQLNHLNDAKKKFEEELFPFMEGESLNNEPHPRIALLQELQKLEAKADAELNAINILTIQSNIDDLDLASAKELLENAEHELEKAGKFVQQAELHVEKEAILMQIAHIALKKADSMAQAQAQSEKAAKARAAAAKAKIKAAKAGLDAKLALWAGSRQRGVEAGRIRSGLDRPAVLLLDISRYCLDEARRAYATAFHSALEAYRELVRYCLATFFNEDGSNGAMALPKFIRPDLLTLPDTWHNSLNDWLDKLQEQITSRSGKLAVQFQAFHWDLTLEQIAALTSPSGLRLEIVPQIPAGYSLLDIPAHLMQKGKISQEAHDYLNAKGLAVTKQAEFIPVNSTDTAEPVLLWRLFDQAQYEVPVKLYDEAGKVLREVKVLSSSDHRAYEVVKLKRTDSDTLLHIRHWPDRHRGDRQQPVFGRSLPSDRYRYNIPASHAKNGRLVALFAELRDYPGDVSMASGDFDMLVTFLGNNWNGRNSVQLQRSASLSRFRIAEVETLVTDELGLRGLFRSEMRADVDGDIDLTNIQGTPVAGTTRIKFFLNRLPDAGKTVGSVRIAVLYKHYSS